MSRVEHANRVSSAAAVGLLVVALAVSGGEATAEETKDCCSCRFSATEALSGGQILPCEFDHPASWQPIVGDDGATVHVAVGPPPCATPCAGSPGIVFSVAKKPNANAESMEEVWRQVLPVAGTARCGGVAVTFFSTPGSDADGQTGGLRFHVGRGGKKYGATATFICSRPGEWPRLQEVFTNTFRTKTGSTFGGR